MNGSRLNPLLTLTVSAAAILSVAGFGTLSCANKNSAQLGGNGQPLYPSSDQLGPAKQPGWNAVLLYQDWEIPVQVDQKVEGTEIVIRLLAKDQELEIERYRSTPSTFQLVQAANEEFDPPLTLLSFPLTEGSLPKWAGKLKLGEISKDATATVIVRKAPLGVKGYDDGVKAEVKVSFDGGGVSKTVRVLNFWFVPGQGVLKREYEKGTTRIPVTPGLPAEGKSG